MNLPSIGGRRFPSKLGWRCAVLEKAQATGARNAPWMALTSLLRGIIWSSRFQLLLQVLRIRHADALSPIVMLSSFSRFMFVSKELRAGPSVC